MKCVAVQDKELITVDEAIANYNLIVVYPSGVALPHRRTKQ